MAAGTGLGEDVGQEPDELSGADVVANLPRSENIGTFVFFQQHYQYFRRRR